MLQPVRCIKLGEILLDENRRTLVLCSRCHTDYENLNDFQQHFEFCGADTSGGGASMRGIFANNFSLVFPPTKRGQEPQHVLARYANNDKEYQIYKYNGIQRLEEPRQAQHSRPNNDDDFMDLIKIEEELLDPRWYSELGSTQIVSEPTSDLQPTQQQTASYSELVEAVTPFVQFKENFKAKRNSSAKILECNQGPPKPKNQILNGLKTGRVLKLNEPDNSTGLKTYILTKPRCFLKPTPNAYLATNNKNSINPPSATNSIKLVESSASNNSIKLPVVSTVGSTNAIQALSNKSGHLGTVTNSKPQLLLLSPEATQKLPTKPMPLTKVTPMTLTKVTLIQPKSTNAIIQTDTQHNKVLKRANESEDAFTNAKLLKPTGSRSSTTTATAFEISLNSKDSKPAPSKAVQTQQIINKLQTLGLQVKRKEPVVNLRPPSPSTSTSDVEKERTLQIIKKLQSKGMNVKIIQPTKLVEECQQPQDVQKQQMTETYASQPFKSQVKRNLIIKKFNYQDLKPFSDDKPHIN